MVLSIHVESYLSGSLYQMNYYFYILCRPAVYYMSGAAMGAAILFLLIVALIKPIQEVYLTSLVF